MTAEFQGEIGVGRADITPPPDAPARNWGASPHDRAAGVHRPLTATALAIARPTAPPLVLLTADLGWWRSGEDEARVREAVRAALGLDAAGLVIAFTHTHSGPSLDPAFYLERVRDGFIAAARSAIAARRPARLSWRHGRCDLARNRDLREPGGNRHVVGFNAGWLADDTLLVGKVEAAGGGIVATLVNYACHPTTLAWENRLISPDYPGAMRELVEGATGAPCLFLQGASGDLAPAEQYVGDPAVADRHGRRLGHAVLACLEAWPDETLAFRRVVESGAPLAVFAPGAARPAEQGIRAQAGSIPLALKPLEDPAAIERELANCADRVLGERLRRRLALRRSIGDGKSMDVPLWIWRLGDFILVAGPAEPYSEFQRELRGRFPQCGVAVLNLANGCCGYLPPRGHYSRDQYTVTQTPFAAGSLEVYTAAAVDRVASLLS